MSDNSPPRTNGKTSVALHSEKSRPSKSRNGKGSPPKTVLGAIDEDGGMAPDIPARSSRRAGAAFLASLFPPAYSKHPPAPPPRIYEDVEGPNGEKFEDVRQNKKVGPVQQKAFRRLILIVCIIVILMVVVAIGLVIGLTRRNRGPPGDGPPGEGRPGDSSDTSFPVGSYTFTTFLASAITSCTGNTATWRCYPYQTYNESQTGAISSLAWVIEPRAGERGGNRSLSISSASNPFSLSFSNATLNLIDQGTEDEAYTFSAPMQYVVVPSAAITNDGSTAECYYNNAVLSAKLYTKKAKTYPANSQASNATTGEFADWPFAVEYHQMADPGANVPSCFKVRNGAIGDRVDVATISSDGQACSCDYFNFGT